MCRFEELLGMNPFSLAKEQKRALLTDGLKRLTLRHLERCGAYRRMMDAAGFDPEKIGSYEEIPFLPVSLFKELPLLSIGKSDIFKVITSSGTTGQAVSKIYLDKETANRQQKALVKIVSDFTGTARLPMLIIDSPAVLKDRTTFSARGAGILGFSIFGTDRTYALDDEMRFDAAAVGDFLARNRGRKILLFGFTFMVWQHFCKELQKSGAAFDFSDGVLIHGGGWKKLASESVSRAEFRRRLKDVCGLEDIHDYYGMAEQTGSVYMECAYGRLHASNFSDVIVRRPQDFSLCEAGEPGILQTVSVLPESYPGHSLLTEDTGVLLGEDDCPCGRKGKYFEVRGRLKNAEIRGCSDTYAAQFG